MTIYNYKPNLFQIRNALHNQEIDFAILIDNSDNQSDLSSYLEEVFPNDMERIVYLRNGENIGLSKAINLGFNEAKKLNSDLVFVMDQDANFPENYFETLKSAFYRAKEKDSKIGILGPIVSNSEIVLYSELGFRKEVSRVQNLINSGMLIPFTTIESVGIMNESLFLGSIDTEYIKRILNKGLTVYRLNRVMLWQNFGMTIVPKEGGLRIFNLLMRFYSLFMVILGKSNEYLYWISYYTSSRTNLMKEELSANPEYDFTGFWGGLVSETLHLIIRKWGGYE